MINLSDFQKDQLIEIINIGAGNASTALAQMTGGKISIQRPEVFVDQVEKIPAHLKLNSEDLMTAVLLKLTGEANGIVMLAFSPQTATGVAKLLTRNHKKSIEVMDEIDRSALCEMGNILSGAAMNALAKFLNLNIINSIPDTATDMSDSIMNSILAAIGVASDEVLLFKIDFIFTEKNITSQMYFFFEPAASRVILQKSAEKVGKV